jgi:hypothetical protein
MPKNRSSKAGVGYSVEHEKSSNQQLVTDSTIEITLYSSEDFPSHPQQRMRAHTQNATKSHQVDPAIL